MFSAPLAPLRLLLYLSIITGVVMCGLEAYPNRHFFYEGWALLLWLKLVVNASCGSDSWTSLPCRSRIVLAFKRKPKVGS